MRMGTLSPIINEPGQTGSKTCQEVSPTGGFGPEIPYKRHIPKRGPPGWVWLTGISALISWGFWMHSRGFRVRMELDRERQQSRLYLLPLLTAEADRQYLQKKAESLAIEMQIMRNIPGWKVGESLYHSKEEFVPETFLLSTGKGSK